MYDQLTYSDWEWEGHASHPEALGRGTDAGSNGAKQRQAVHDACPYGLQLPVKEKRAHSNPVVVRRSNEPVQLLVMCLGPRGEIWDFLFLICFRVHSVIFFSATPFSRRFSADQASKCSGVMCCDDRSLPAGSVDTRKKYSTFPLCLPLSPSLSKQRRGRCCF